MSTFALPASRRVRVLGIGLALAALTFGVLAEHRVLGAALSQIRDLPRPSWPPVVIAVAAIGFSYWCSAVALRAASGRDLPMGRTLLVQLAAAAANRVTPGGVGGVAINGRFLTRQGLTVGRSAAALSLNGVAHLIVAALGIGIAAPSVGLPHTRFLAHGALQDAALVAAIVLAVTLVSWTAVKAARRSMARGGRLGGLLRDLVAGLVDAMRHPRRLVVLVTAVAAVKATNLLALIAITRAFDGDIAAWRVAVVYLVGVPVAEAIPTPGGLGTVDAMLIAGLTTAGGVAIPAVVAAVILFRLITFWGPIIPGALASGVLRRRLVL